MEKRRITLSYIFFAHHPFSEISRTFEFTLFDKKINLCARCMGKYLGLITYLTTIIILGSLQTPLLLTLILPLPATLDWFTQTMKLRESFNLLRITTGFCFGFWVGIVMHALVTFNIPLISVLGLQAFIYTAAVFTVFIFKREFLHDYVRPYEEFIVEYQKQKTMQV